MDSEVELGFPISKNKKGPSPRWMMALHNPAARLATSSVPFDRHSAGGSEGRYCLTCGAIHRAELLIHIFSITKIILIYIVVP